MLYCKQKQKQKKLASLSYALDLNERRYNLVTSVW